MRYGVPTEPHPMQTFPPPFPGSRLEQVIAFTRSTHMIPRRAVEVRIAASFPKDTKKKTRRRAKRDPDRR
jgi:hypothetical protein